MVQLYKEKQIKPLESLQTDDIIELTDTKILIQAKIISKTSI